MPDALPALPAGYRARPASAEDVPALHGLVAACEHALHGRAQTDPGAVAADLQHPGSVPELDTLLVHDRAGRPAARARVNRRSEVDVHPAHRGGSTVLRKALAEPGRTSWAGSSAVPSPVARYPRRGGWGSGR